jgi:hypothetical protein
MHVIKIASDGIVYISSFLMISSDIQGILTSTV